MGYVPVECITRYVHHWIYSCKASIADWGLEWIHLAACIFVATGLSTWHYLFFTAFHIGEGGMPSIRLYTMPSAFAQANCISRHLVNLVIFLTWVIQSINGLSPLPLYICKSVKKWSFLYWVYNLENVEIVALVLLCKAFCWLNIWTTDGSVPLVDDCSSWVVPCGKFKWSCRDSGSPNACFALLAVYILILGFENSACWKCGILICACSIAVCTTCSMGIFITLFLLILQG